MKYLKKINENNDNESIKEYVEQCFINFLDNDIGFTYTGDNKVIMMEMFIDIPEQNKLTIDGLLEFSNYLQDISLEIKECFEKVNIKYPKIECYSEIIRDTSYNGHGELYLSINISIIYHRK